MFLLLLDTPVAAVLVLEEDIGRNFCVENMCLVCIRHAIIL